MNKKQTAYLQLHLSVVLYGLTAILGNLISIKALYLVWWRVLIASLSFIFLAKSIKALLIISPRLLKIYGLIGFLVGIHWVTFYGAIKLANASVVLAAFASTSFFTALIEPAIHKKRPERYKIITGLLVVPPMLLIAQNIDLSMQLGFAVALFSAFLAALFASLNKKWVDETSPLQISFIEMLSAFLLISLIIPFEINDIVDILPQAKDWIYLIILSLVCTTFAFLISMKALKHVSAFDANLIINLEPVYGIILAVVILKEHKQMSPGFYIGMLLIVFIVFSYPFLEKYVYGKK